MVPVVIGHCLGVVSRLLVPSSLILPSSSSPSSLSPHRHINVLPPPNEHILALRCLLHLPPKTWDQGGKMGEGEMGVVMEGVGSGDAGVRRLVRPFPLLSVDVGCGKVLNVISRKRQ